MRSTPQPFSLDDPTATYLIVGGLGGIGQAVAYWMMDKGAQNVLIVSRSAKQHPDAQRLLETAAREARNVQIHDCDVSSEQSLVRLLDHIGDSMPPIRGVVDAAMVLDVRRP